MQAWFAVHGPLLQRSAAKDSLWHRVLSALAPPTAGDIARGMVQKSGNAKIVMRHAFRNFKNQCNKVTSKDSKVSECAVASLRRGAREPVWIDVSPIGTEQAFTAWQHGLLKGLLQWRHVASLTQGPIKFRDNAGR